MRPYCGRTGSKLGGQPALARYQTPLWRRRRRAAAWLDSDRIYTRSSGRRAPVEPLTIRAICGRSGRVDGQSGSTAGQGRFAGDLPQRLAGRSGCQPGRTDVPRSEPLPGQQRAARRQAYQPGTATRRPDSNMPRARAIPTGMPPSLPTLKPDLAARSMSSN